MTPRQANRKFVRVSSVCFGRLKRTAEYEQAARYLEERGFDKRAIDLELEREVLYGRFVDFDRFCRKLVGGGSWRDRFRNFFD